MSSIKQTDGTTDRPTDGPTDQREAENDANGCANVSGQVERRHEGLGVQMKGRNGERRAACATAAGLSATAA